MGRLSNIIILTKIYRWNASSAGFIIELYL
jgi:hypothetical protein